ncbi:hypothetical protein VTO42DRAFT_4783 [Malbranchea cinnamomea]
MNSPRSGKSSASWGRRKPDPLEEAGYASKGDVKLLDVKAQEAYYDTIVARYTRFCTTRPSEGAFRLLPRISPNASTSNPPIAPAPNPPADSPATQKPAHRVLKNPKNSTPHVKSAEQELTTILLALRKLREAILATKDRTPVSFAQRVHILCIRVGILSEHPPTFYPPLKRLLTELDTEANPLSHATLQEFTSYMILDTACRREDFGEAYLLREKARARFCYRSHLVDDILSSIINENWVLFWEARKAADAYTKVFVDWAAPWIRRRTLKSIAASYITVDLRFIIKCCTGEEDGMTWEELVELEGLGWRLEGDKVIIKKIKPKAALTAAT